MPEGGINENMFMESLEKTKNNDDDTDLATALSELLAELSSTEKDVLFSELSEREIKHISVLETIDDQLMDDFVTNFRNNKVSKKRRGRKELVDVADSLSDLIAQKETQSLTEKAKSLIG